MAHKPTDLRPLMARIPESLRLRLVREAKRNDRSLNAEITERLARSFDPLTLDLFPQIVAEIENAVRRASAPITYQGQPIYLDEPIGPAACLVWMGDRWVEMTGQQYEQYVAPASGIAKPDQPFVGEGIVQLKQYV